MHHQDVQCSHWGKYGSKSNKPSIERITVLADFSVGGLFDCLRSGEPHSHNSAFSKPAAKRKAVEENYHTKLSPRSEV